MSAEPNAVIPHTATVSLEAYVFLQSRFSNLIKNILHMATPFLSKWVVYSSFFTEKIDSTLFS